MKSIILLGDGMADEPLKELGDKTPLDVAYIPYMDKLASRGDLGMVRTIKTGFPPGSDVANMTVLGLDPEKYYSGRAPIEATSMGVELSEQDTAFRINLVTLTQREPGYIMEDYCSDHISTTEAAQVVQSLKELLRSNEKIRVYPGVEYRHLMVINGYEFPDLRTTPPHDIIGEYVDNFLPNDPFLRELIFESMKILADHSVNVSRRKQGKREATAIWPWGEGKVRGIPTLQDEFGIS
ncbi:MAG TPA: phosphoglycerate mutase, partial [Deltaproteobacteria bacterium]|nr:phosphoglycerate mutase [Deltaproteobacteria bacterium]